MFKVVKIENKQIPLKCDGSTAVKYSRFFNRNLISDFAELAKLEDKVVDSNVLEMLAWTMAKSADNNIPDLEEWLSQFDSPMSIYYSAKDILGLLHKSFRTTKQPKKK
jgi:hypothetical protein